MAGWSQEKVECMDMLSFRSLAESVQRVQAGDVVRDTYLKMGAAQGTPESLQEMLKPIMELAGGQDDTSRAQAGLSKLLADHGGGF